ELEKYRLVFKTYVKDTYFLDNDALSNLKSSYKLRAESASWPTQTLYRLTEVIDLFCTIHGIDRNDSARIQRTVNELKSNADKKKIERYDRIQRKKNMQYERRKKKLVDKL